MKKPETHTGAFAFLGIRKDGPSTRLGGGERGRRRAKPLAPLIFMSGAAFLYWPTFLPSLPTLHLALIKYIADDVSLAPGSLSFPLGLGTKHPGRQL